MSRRLTTSEFVANAVKVHGDKYDYSGVIYCNARTNVILRCKFHNFTFEQTPDNHLHGKGCFRCGLKKQVSDRTLTLEEFVHRSNSIHKDKYDYSKVLYKNTQVPVTIICRVHGSFKQLPTNHLAGNGCPSCHHRVSSAEEKFLDYVGIPNASRQLYIAPYKVDGFDSKTNTVYEFFGNYFHGNPRYFDWMSYNKTCHKTYGELYAATILKMEALFNMGYSVKYVWEDKWDRFKNGLDKTLKIEEYGPDSSREI